MALPELLYLFAMGWGGIGLLMIVGVRRPGLLANAAVIGFVVVATLSFLVSLLLQISPVVVSMGLAAITGLFSSARSHFRTNFFSAMTIYVPLALSAWGWKWLIGIPERVGEDAISVMLQSVLEMQTGQPPSDPRRGFAYPLVIAFSDQGTILSSSTTLVSLSLLGLIAIYAWDLLKTHDMRHRALIVGVALIAFASTPIFLVSMSYTNSHMLMAIAITAIAGTLTSSLRKLKIEYEEFGLLLISILVGTLTRYEGALLVSILLVGLYLQPALFNSTGWRLFVISSAPITGFSIWNALIPRNAMPNEAIWVFLMLVLAPLLLFGLGQALGRRVERLLPGFISLGLVIAVITLTTFKYPGSEVHFVLVAIQNLLIGVGGWGAFLSATLVIAALSRLRHSGRLLKFVGQIVLWGVLTTICVKLLDSPPGNLGFNNTIVRTMLHWSGPLVLFWALAFGEKLGKLRNSSTERGVENT